ncbi:MAG: DUF3365 domain-containing protein [Thermodesulfobacteriota bacterium]
MAALRSWSVSRLSLSLSLLIFAAVTLLSALFVYPLLQARTLVQAERQARILLERNLATHAFYAHTLRPRVFELAQPVMRQGYFDPAWMSSTYAVREITKEHAAIAPDSKLYYKECARNARSPENEADAYESAFIQDLNRDPGLTIRSETRELDGETYFQVLHRGEAMEAPCLRCHSTPDAAPSGLVDRYGAERSFGRSLGEVVSAVSIRIPVSQLLAEARHEALAVVGLVALATGLIILAAHLLTRRALFAPLESISEQARRVTEDPSLLGEELPPPLGREVATLTRSFNAMSVHLHAVLASLTGEVAERVRAEEALRRNELLLLETGRMARVGGWEFDPASGKGSWTEEAARIHEVDPAEATSIERSLRFYHGESRSRLAAAFNEAVLRGRPFDLELEMTTAQGRAIWVRIICNPILENGGVVLVRGSIQDVTESRTVTEALRLAKEQTEAANVRLRELDAMKSVLLSSVSHEMRTPLTSIIGFARLARKEADRCLDRVRPAGGDAADRLDRVIANLEVIGEEGRRLTRMIEQVLGLTELEDSRTEWLDQDVSLAEAIDAAAARAENLLQAKPGLSLRAEVPDAPVRLRVDPRRLGQVLDHLLENAIRFSESGQIRIQGGVAAGRAAIRVADQGPGMDRQTQERIFDHFFQVEADRSLSDKPQGFGLGLPLCKRIVERYRGGIRVESEPGRGSTFVVELPLAEGEA